MDSESPQVIEQQMEETRQSLTEKVAAVENQVVGTLQTGTQAVQDTVATVKSVVEETVSSVRESVQESVAAVKDTVQDSVTAVTDNVKETFDVTQHVQNHPYAMLGGAMVAGLVTGLVVFKMTERRTAAPAPLAYPPDFDAPQGSYPVMQPAKQHSGPGILDEMLAMAGIEAKELAREAVNQASQAVRQHVLPSLMQWVTQSIENAFQPATGAANPHRPWESPERATMART